MEQKEDITNDHVLSNTDLAFERTVLAENRTLMAWVRTAISLISFGFTIYKFFHEASRAAGNSNRIFTPRTVGMIMISFGLLGLVWGLAEHQALMKKLKKSYPALERSKTSWLAILVLLFGLALFLAAFLKQ